MTLPPKGQWYSENFNHDYGNDYFSYYRQIFVANNKALEKDLLRLLRSLEKAYDVYTEFCERHEDMPGWESLEGQIAKTLGSPELLIGFLPGAGEEPE